MKDGLWFEETDIFSKPQFELLNKLPLPNESASIVAIVLANETLEVLLQRVKAVQVIDSDPKIGVCHTLRGIPVVESSYILPGLIVGVDRDNNPVKSWKIEMPADGTNE